MESTIGKKGKVLHSQAREIIASTIEFMRQEAEDNAPIIPLSNYKQRVLTATRISESSYKQIAKESRSIQSGASTSFRTPHKERPRVSPKSTLWEGDMETIRSIIHNFYITEKRRPTLKGIHNKIMDSGVDFHGGITTLRKVIRGLGFKWRKTTDKRRVLMETQVIRYKRIVYLEALRKYKAEGRPIIYTDESYIHSSHTVPKEWSDDSTAGLKKPVSKGRRLIMVHAGNENGFIPNALLMFRSGAKSGDYHDDMNSENFTRWVTTQLIPNLPPDSVLVIDNASYHNVTVTKNPTFATSKKDMIVWLVERNIIHDPNQTKAQLYELIKLHKPRHQVYQLDALMHKHGHSVLRLPPYHPELNPIEKIWATVKNYVAARNTTFKLADVEKLALEKFNAITAEEWSAICSHVDKVVDSYVVRERQLDEAADTLQFMVNTVDSEDDEFDDDDDYEEEEEGGGGEEAELSGIEELSD